MTGCRGRAIIERRRHIDAAARVPSRVVHHRRVWRQFSRDIGDEGPQQLQLRGTVPARSASHPAHRSCYQRALVPGAHARR